jgi:hypothetical protein
MYFLYIMNFHTCIYIILILYIVLFVVKGSYLNDYVILKSSVHAYICAHGYRIYLTTCGGSLDSKCLVMVHTCLSFLLPPQVVTLECHSIVMFSTYPLA